jgi:hypothetical protein
MVFSALNINLMKDFAERTIYLQATTRGDNKVKKEITVGVKKACKFDLPTSYEYVFDHGYAGDTYGVEDMIQVFNATTGNLDEGSTHQEWSGSCNMDTIIYERLSDTIHQINKTETLKYQTLFEPTD